MIFIDSPIEYNMKTRRLISKFFPNYNLIFKAPFKIAFSYPSLTFNHSLFQIKI